MRGFMHYGASIRENKLDSRVSQLPGNPLDSLAAQPQKGVKVMYMLVIYVYK